jgi:ferritin-like metal-binding protein YciE
MPLDTLHDLLVHELRDLHSAEQQLLDALPLLAKAARSDTLRKLFEQHLEETRGQLDRLAQLFRGLAVPPEGKTCKGMQGLISEARETIQEEADPEVLDAALIVIAQKVEHYEIAGYGSARTFAQELGYADAARLLEQTLREESATDEKLTRAAEKRVNQRAAHAAEASV